MNHRNRIYHLRDGRKVTLVGSYSDFFSDEQFLVLRENGQVFIARALEFSANLMPELNSPRRTADEKIRLYRSYFRGNDRMVATSFQKQDGKRAYYVWCQQRKKGPCPKLKNKNFQCSACHFQKFQPLNDQVIFDHLRGFNDRHQEAFYGIYPITAENTVYFLVFDFDKKEWKKEVTALIRSVEEFQIEPLLELSQSGKGCHVWFFFETAVTAKQARKLGTLLLRHAMLQYPELSFDSFDRLFPSQDEVTTGGFGNLIALPLQGSRVKKGCSRFVDKKFKLIEDIWGALAKTPKLSSADLDKLIKKIEQQVPVQFYQVHEKEEEILLFEESESPLLSFKEPIKIVRGSELIIQRSEISKEALVQLKFLATFHNQAYYIAQRKRLPTRDIPRVISLAEVNKDTIRLPRGLEEKVADLFPNAEYLDEYSEGKKITVRFNGELYKEQVEALAALEKKDIGILCAGTGFGKTVIAGKLIADKKINTLILVNNKNLAIQWKSQLERFLTIEDQPFEEFTKTGRKRKKDQIGKFYGGQSRLSGLVDIALFQSITKEQNIEELLDQYGMIIVDEAHHVAAKTFEDVIRKAKCRFLYGLTATPRREDHLENILYMRLGEIAFKATKKIPNHIDQHLYMRFTGVGEQVANPEQATIHENYEKMIASNERNQQIISDICDNVDQNRHIIVLSRYVKHLKVLKNLLEKANLKAPIYSLNSKMKAKDLREELVELKREGRPFVLLTTGSYAGEGFDLPALDTLMLVMPISGKGNLQQYLGRLLRNLDEKHELRVYDYVDYAIPMIYRMYQKRLSTYKKLGYQLYEDGQTELSKSNLFTDGYQVMLDKDLKQAQTGLLSLPYLNKGLFTQLISIESAEKYTLVLPNVSGISEKNRQAYQNYVQQLLEQGFKIDFKTKVSQYFAVVDHKIVWLLPNDSENAVALRILSVEIAERLINYFNK